MKLESSIVLLLFTGLLYGCNTPLNQVQNGKFLPPCGKLPNCVSSQSANSLHYVAPISASPEQWRSLNEWISRQEDWEIVGTGNSYVQAVVSTPLLKFRDDVQLVYLPEEKLVHVRSASRLGISDLGTNATRITKLRIVATMTEDS